MSLIIITINVSCAVIPRDGDGGDVRRRRARRTSSPTSKSIQSFPYDVTSYSTRHWLRFNSSYYLLSLHEWVIVDFDVSSR